MRLTVSNQVAAWLIPLLLALISMIGSGVLAYQKTDARITALESHRSDDKDKLDHIQTQVDKLVEWALGHK